MHGTYFSVYVAAMIEDTRKVFFPEVFSKILHIIRVKRTRRRPIPTAFYTRIPAPEKFYIQQATYIPRYKSFECLHLPEYYPRVHSTITSTQNRIYLADYYSGILMAGKLRQLKYSAAVMV